MITREFIEKIPKTDLHLHLDGSLRLPTLIDLAKQENVDLPSFDDAGLRSTVFRPHYANLQEYLRGFEYTCAVLRNPENLERVAFELAEDNLAEGVRYIEIRLAPQLHMRWGMAMEQVLSAVTAGVRKAQQHHNNTAAVREGRDLPFAFGLIVCAMRSFHPEMSHYFKKLFEVMPLAPRKEVFSNASLQLVREAVALRDEKALPIVGFDLAGEEAGFPAATHVEAYQYAHRHFLKKTVHAGEAYGPESIFQAITECHANRIGHGTFLFATDMIRDPAITNPRGFVEGLVEHIAGQRINVEVCLTSNLQTCPEIRRVEDHPLGRMLEHNLSVSICTDNRLVSDTTVCRELGLAAEHFGATAAQFRNLVIAGFKGSFFPGTYAEKRAYVRKAIDLYDRVAAARGG